MQDEFLDNKLYRQQQAKLGWWFFQITSSLFSDKDLGMMTNDHNRRVLTALTINTVLTLFKQERLSVSVRTRYM